MNMKESLDHKFVMRGRDLRKILLLSFGLAFAVFGVILNILLWSGALIEFIKWI